MPEISKKRVLFFLLGIFFLFLFGVFSFIVKEDLLDSFDFDTTVRLQNIIPRRFDDIFAFFSVLGSVEITSIALLIMLIVRRKIDGFFIAFGFGMFLVIELFGKIIVDHPGPPYMFARYKSLVDFPSHYVPHPHGAYPSGHSGRTVFLGLLLLFFLFNSKNAFTPVKLAIAAFIAGFTLTMIISRVYLGEHWSTDVIGGTLLATSMAFFSMSALQWKFRKHHKEEG
jgi:undecaprenyl-diphosphatase